MALNLLSTLATQAGTALTKRFMKNKDFDPTDAVPRFIKATEDVAKAVPPLAPQIKGATAGIKAISNGVNSLFPKQPQVTPTLSQGPVQGPLQPVQQTAGVDLQNQAFGQSGGLILPPPSAPQTGVIETVSSSEINLTQPNQQGNQGSVTSGQSTQDVNLTDLASQIAQAGGSVDDFLNLARGIQGGGADIDEIKNELGIPDLIEDQFKAPTETAQDIYKRAFDEAGLPALKQQILDIDSQISTARNQLNEAIGEELNNPFISAASRSARIRNAQQLAENRIGNLEANRGALTGLYNQGLDQVEGLVTGVLQQSENDRIRSAEQLNFLLDEADRRLNRATAEQDRELFRFVPEFLQQQAEFSGQPTELDLLKLQEQRLKNQKLASDISGGGSGSGKPPTSSQFQAATYVNRMGQAEETFIGKNDFILGLGTAGLIAERLKPEFMKSEDFKLYEQAERNFINATLRRESGAAIADSEFENARKQYLPQPGDTQAVLDEKARNRAIVRQGLSREAGNALEADPLDSAFGTLGFNNDLSRSQNGSNLGDLSSRYESSGRPDAIGYDSTGGYSYGTYQLAHNNAKKFVENSSFGGYFKGLRFNSPEFRNRWQEVAQAFPEQFEAEQKNYIKQTHFDPQVQKMAKAGIDINWFSDTVKDVIWSTAVQHGANTDIVVKAIKGLGNKFKESDLVNAIYNERWAGGKRFASSTPAVKKAVYNRFFGNNGERNLALSRLS